MIAEVKGLHTFEVIGGCQKEIWKSCKSIEALSQLGNNERISEAEINPMLFVKRAF